MKPTDEDKQKILGKIEEALDQGATFLILTEGRPEAAVMMGGTENSMAQMLSIAMSRIPELEDAVKMARKALKTARKNKEHRHNFDSELMKCETCDKKDDCHIRSLKEKVMGEGAGPGDLMEVLKALTEKHGPIVDIKNQGDC
jgi:hypothetical protein